MADGNGIKPFDPWLNEAPGVPPGSGINVDDAPLVIVMDEDDSDGEPPDVQELEDGSLLVSLNGKLPKGNQGGAGAHNANLAEYIDQFELARIADELLDGIDADLRSREEWISRRAQGIKHLALKVENPRSPSADADTAVEGQSTIRTPIMLDAVLRFQANARGELLPAGGPVKIRNDTTLQVPSLLAASALTPLDDADFLAEALEKDMNHYLTVTDREYYTDTNRMFFMQGFGGCGFKKIYRDPIKRRPVSRSVDADDIIVSDNEVSLHDCGRVTHRIMMRQSVFKRMQLAGVYLDIEVQTPTAPNPDAVERAEDDVAGLGAGYFQRPADYKHTVYESYCEFDIAGFEHKEDGKATGLPLPYRITIDKDSKQIMEVIRNWREDDDRFIKRMPIVKFPFVEGMGFYGIGLLNIMGNATAAITTAWRLALDSGGFSSWPGFLYSETVGRQDTMTFRVGLGAGAKINTGGQPISQHIMSLPYKDATPGLVQMTQHIEEEARRVGGTPELMTGEGRQDVPVGTTLAMLDQAVKVIDSVHKGMHIAQAEELSLLRDLFLEDPESLICSNPTPAYQWQREDLIKALRNCNLTPQADPNTPSHTIRVMKAVALVQLVQMDPTKWDIVKVIRRVSAMVGLGSVDELLVPPQGDQPQPADPKAMAEWGKIQVKMRELATKEQDAARKQALEEVQGSFETQLERMKIGDKAADRQSNERIANKKIEMERMKLAQAGLVHAPDIPIAGPFALNWPVQTGSRGGRVI